MKTNNLENFYDFENAVFQCCFRFISSLLRKKIKKQHYLSEKKIDSHENERYILIDLKTSSFIVV